MELMNSPSIERNKGVRWEGQQTEETEETEARGQGRAEELHEDRKTARQDGRRRQRQTASKCWREGEGLIIKWDSVLLLRLDFDLRPQDFLQPLRNPSRSKIYSDKT